MDQTNPERVLDIHFPADELFSLFTIGSGVLHIIGHFDETIQPEKEFKGLQTPPPPLAGIHVDEVIQYFNQILELINKEI